jgi:hypothetical protein
VRESDNEDTTALRVEGAVNPRKSSKLKLVAKVLEGAIIRYGQRAPGLERHELLQNLWLETKGLVTKRLRGRASRHNPTIALSAKVHDVVDRYQRALGLFDRVAVGKMSLNRVLRLNAEALRHAGVDEETVDELVKAARAHYASL